MIAKFEKSIVPKKNIKQKVSKKQHANEVASPNAKSSRLSKEQKQEIEAQADDETGVISKEVGQLLAHLKKEHSLPADEPATKTSGKKKNKPKKGDSIETPSESKWQGMKATDIHADSGVSPHAEVITLKEKNQKVKKHKLEVELEGNKLPGIPKSKKKKNDATQVAESHPKKKTTVETESLNNSVTVAETNTEKDKQEVTVKRNKKKAVGQNSDKKPKAVDSLSQKKSAKKQETKKQKKISDEMVTENNEEEESASENNDKDNETTDDKPKTGKSRSSIVCSVY